MRKLFSTESALVVYCERGPTNSPDQGPFFVWDGATWSQDVGAPQDLRSAVLWKQDVLVLEQDRGADGRLSFVQRSAGLWRRNLPPPSAGAEDCIVAGERLFVLGKTGDEEGQLGVQWLEEHGPGGWERRWELDRGEWLRYWVKGGADGSLLIRTHAIDSESTQVQLMRDRTLGRTRASSGSLPTECFWVRDQWVGMRATYARDSLSVQFSRLEGDTWVPWLEPIRSPGHDVRAFAQDDAFFLQVESYRIDGVVLWEAAGDRLVPRGRIGGSGSEVVATARWGGDRYYGGRFGSVFGRAAWNLVRERDGELEPLWRGTGVDGSPEHLTPFGGGIAVAGEMEHAGVDSCAGIAIFTAGEWSPIPASAELSVNALHEFQGQLVVGGDSDSPERDDAVTTRVWSGDTWDPIGTSLQYGEVEDLLTHDGELIAIGSFLRSQGHLVRGVAAWNGQDWRGFGIGIPNDPWIGVSWSDQLVVGGQFRRAGYANVENIASWNGFEWAPLGVGLTLFEGESGLAYVNDLTVHGGLLVAVGQFHRAGAVASRGIALWDGVAWRSYAQGTRDGIRPVALRKVESIGGELWAWGSFVLGREQSRFALCRWVDPDWHLVVRDISLEDMRATPNGSLWFAASRPQSLSSRALSYDLLRLDRGPSVRLVQPQVITIDALGPIPARGSLDVRYSLTRNAPLRYGLYNVGGRRIVEIDGGVQAAGPHAIHIDAESLSLPLILSGVYFLRIEAGDDVV
ncbi:MAG: hypothetical protein IT349_10035, partial [Candidatus Eisenbacteria bacterium]|nr:hypothetical protein [Candidatus Eisenbacteria bacterium]